MRPIDWRRKPSTADRVSAPLSDNLLSFIPMSWYRSVPRMVAHALVSAVAAVLRPGFLLFRILTVIVGVRHTTVCSSQVDSSWMVGWAGVILLILGSSGMGLTKPRLTSFADLLF